MPTEDSISSGLCRSCGEILAVLGTGCLAEHKNGDFWCSGSAVPLLAQKEGEAVPSVEAVVQDAENGVLLVVEREPDPLRLRFIAGVCSTLNATSASLHRDQVREVVAYLDLNTQAARGVLMPALITAANGGELEFPSVNWGRELPRGQEEFRGGAGQKVGFDLVHRPLVKFALFVHDHGVAGPRRVGLVLSIDAARGLRDDLRRSLDWMDTAAALGPIGVGS